MIGRAEPVVGARVVRPTVPEKIRGNLLAGQGGALIELFIPFQACGLAV